MFRCSGANLPVSVPRISSLLACLLQPLDSHLQPCHQPHNLYSINICSSLPLPGLLLCLKVLTLTPGLNSIIRPQWTLQSRQRHSTRQWLDDALCGISDQLQQITTALANLTVRLNAAPAPVAPPPAASAPPVQPVQVSGSAFIEPHIPPPAKYSGDPNTCRQFLTQCQLAFNAQPNRYASEAARVAYLVNLLEGPPLTHYNALFEKGSTLANSAGAFANELKRVFDHPIRGQQAGQRLSRIRQGRMSVREYVSCFQSLAVESGWNDAALITAFQGGLNRDIGKELALRGDFMALDGVIGMAIKVGDQLSLWGADAALSPAYRCEQPTPLEPRRNMPNLPEPEPMQIDGIHLSPEEKARRIKTQSCLYCGRADHFIAQCPVRPPKGPARQ